jgi:hypothetical protein
MLGNAGEIKKTLLTCIYIGKLSKIKWYNTKNTFLKVYE